MKAWMRQLGDGIKWLCCLLWGYLTDLCSPAPEPDPPEPPPDPPAEIDPDERIGLALSGGGFRAAFFHLGVLARLAEAGILPRVQVISTVSGGSIIGTAYYLLVKNLLEKVPEKDLRRSDYVELVAILEQRMRIAVRKGIRGRIYANPIKNLAMVWPWLLKGRRYSRTDRIGDLADRHLYKEIFWPDGDVPERDDPWMPVREWRRDQQVELQDIRIKPADADEYVYPEIYNLEPDREFMVPELGINATCLNTGHRWCFEASQMGEHVGPEGLEEEVVEVPLDATPGQIRAALEDLPPEKKRQFADGNVTLLPGRFVADGVDPDTVGGPPLPTHLQEFPLGHAVAASAAVPGAFPALPISRLYGPTIYLSDGGVADNQGVATLDDHDANFFIISDGSGQMRDLPRMGGGAIASLVRSAGIQSDRIRDLQLDRDYPDVEQSLIHLREGLRPPPLPPNSSSWDPVWPPAGTAVSGWPVHPRALEKVSRIRTDLDRFSREEIDVLAATGYLLTDRHLIAPPNEDGEVDPLVTLMSPVPDPELPTWSFLSRTDRRGASIRDRLAKGDPQLIKRISRGRSKFFRFLKPAAGFLKFALSVLLLGSAVFWAVQNWSEISDRWPDVWGAIGDAMPMVLAVGVAAILALALTYCLGLAILLAFYRVIRGVFLKIRGPGV